MVIWGCKVNIAVYTIGISKLKYLGMNTNSDNKSVTIEIIKKNEKVKTC